MKQRFSKFMYGRYGADELSRLLNGLALALLFISLLLNFGSSNALVTLRSFILVVVLALLISQIFRTFSKNISARRKENAAYLRQRVKVTNFWQLRKDMWRQRKDYKFFKCPSCRAVMRVPKGKGRVRVICKKCGTAFEKKT